MSSHERGRRRRGMLTQELHQALIAELLLVGIERFHDAIRKHHERVVAPQTHFARIAAPAFEQPDHWRGR